MAFPGKDLESIALSVVDVNGNLYENDFPCAAIDSRDMEEGAVFFAIRGEKRDGHDFVADASARAGAIVVDEKWWNVGGAGERVDVKIPIVIVEDTVQALSQLAKIHRKKFSIPVIAVTGSSGKTTTKDMIVRILRSDKKVHHTIGNFNNHLGLPLTVLMMDKSHDVSVVEMGMNHPGEIEKLCAIAEPTHGLITNIGKGHLGYFDSVKEVAREKGMLFRWIESDPSRTAIVNADDERVIDQAKTVAAQFRFGMDREDVDITGSVVSQDNLGRCVFSFRRGNNGDWYTVRLGVSGRHQVRNALAAVASGILLGADPLKICKALGDFTPPEKRTIVRKIGQVTVVDDTYNANPDSMKAAIEMFSEFDIPGKKILVLGDMLELGALSGEEHGRIGLLVADLGFEFVFTLGRESEALYSASAVPFGGRYTDKQRLIRDLLSTVEKNDAVLIKGSRGMKMEEIIEALEKALKTNGIVR